MLSGSVVKGRDYSVAASSSKSFEGRKCFERTAFGAGGERDDNGGVVHSVAFFTFR